MLVLEIRLLTGRYAATEFNDRGHAEWPPHPARVFSALVAALHDDPAPPDDERRALQWLAAAPAPDVIASSAEERQQGEVFVPTNDVSALASMDRYIVEHDRAKAAWLSSDPEAHAAAQRKAAQASAKLQSRSLQSARVDGKGAAASAASLLPGAAAVAYWDAPDRTWRCGHLKQPRRFPVALPTVDCVHVCWSESAPDDVLAAIDRVAARVARIGHSSSLVSVRALSVADIDTAGRQRWTPDENGPLVLRVPTSGQLERLEDDHARHHQVEPHVLPARFERYSDRERPTERPGIAASWFAATGWVVFEVAGDPNGGRRLLLDVSLAQQVARALRGTLLRAADGSWPEELSGHAPDGSPAVQPHLAFVSLPDVGHSFATGTILGVALVPPACLSAQARQALYRAVGAAEHASQHNASDDRPPPLALRLGRAGVLHVRRVRDIAAARTLHPPRWTRAARTWATVSALALGRNPGDLRSRDPSVVARAVDAAETTIETACTNIGLPRPVAVWAHRRSLVAGAPAAHRFAPFPSEGTAPKRVCVHAEVVFDEPVTGPVLLGAGRFLGLGLCMPVD